MDDQVGKLIEPEPVPFSFTTPGWYVVGVLLLLLVVLCVFLLIKHYKNNLYRRCALAFLIEREKRLSLINASGRIVYETQMLIKRIAMNRYGRREVSGLREDKWIAFINSTWREKSFDEKDNELLSRGIYNSSLQITDETVSAFVEKAKRWIRKHKRHYK
jgi:hypothetical protein